MSNARRARPSSFRAAIHEATGTFDIGNPNLRIEAAKTIEIGLRRPVGPFRFEATAYLTRFDGFIFRNLTGAVCEDDIASCAFDGEGDLRQAIYSQRNALFRGGEFQSQLDVAPLAGGVFGWSTSSTWCGRHSWAAATSRASRPFGSAADCSAGHIELARSRVNLLHAFAQRNIDRPMKRQRRAIIC